MSSSDAKQPETSNARKPGVRRAVCAALAAGAALWFAAAAVGGERIVFLGDSITQAGARPGGYVTLVRETLQGQRPELEAEVIGAGVSGNRVPDLEARLERDVIAKKPTLVVIYIGINDVWHSIRGRGTPKDQYEAGLRRIVKRIQDAGANIILCTPSVIGEKPDGSNPLDEMLDEYCRISRRVAADTGVQLLDLRRKFLDYLKEHNAAGAEKGLLTTDGVHLTPAGNRFVADCMLAALEEAMPSDRLLRHVVLFKFKDDAPAEQVQQAVRSFAQLPQKIDTIVDFEYGTDVSVEGLSQGFTHCFIVSFRDEQGRAAYLPHPAHQALVNQLKPILDEVLVIDFWAQSR